MIGQLPDTLTVGNQEYQIETDFRNILVFLEACEDPELNEEEKLFILLKRLFGKRYEFIPQELLPEAARQAKWFVDCGRSEEESHTRKMIDWVQDASIIFPAVNKVAGKEVRGADCIHWWTFMGYFMEIEGGTFSTVLSIRSKKQRGKKLEKWEQEFYQKNKWLCDLKQRHTKEEQEEIDYWNKIL